MDSPSFRSLARALLWTAALSLIAGAAASEDGLTAPRTLSSDDAAPILHPNPKLKFTRGPDGSRPTRLSKRFPFSSGRDEWCGELGQDPWTDFSASAPLAADCRALASSLDDKNGFWTVQPGDFGGDGWVRVAGSGTCSFAVRVNDDSKGSPVAVGTNDIRFYTNRYAAMEQDGKLGLQGSVQCYNGEKMINVVWGLIRS
ncbi:hypothetical protein CMUS01_01293 [Colletotrichum musicola]|uniref:Ecp2 effector protein-like domain-containing protein n=1 Tax=Colletotrichum musicola TaxID=2175873 RepID=A0A8H6NXA7_9PEZI|nr:hypothetical protein CMUS01_01293 [Colletotrichum musicola]